MDALVKQLKAVKILSLLTEKQINTLLEHCESISAAAGDTLFSPEDSLGHYLVLTDGELNTERSFTNGQGETQTRTKTLMADMQEDVIAVLATTGLGYTVRATTELQYRLIDGDLVDVFLGWNQQCSQAIKKDPKLSQRIGLVKQVNVFHQLPLENIQTAFERMTTKETLAGDTIITEGEKGESYFVIESGSAEVWRTDPFTDETSMVADLGPGDAFGEEALLQDGMRNATVKMTAPGRLLVLEKADFDELVQSSILEEVSSDKARDMVNRGEAKWLDCRYEMEYEDSRIPGAPLIPLDRIREDFHKLDQDTTYIVYCRSGRRSRAGAFLLSERKINAYSMTGGIKEWPYEIDAQPIELS